MKKAAIVIVVLLLAAPLLMKLLPEALSAERVRAAYETAGHEISDWQQEPAPQRQAAASWTFHVGDYRIELHEYAQTAKAKTNAEYLKPGSGQAIVDAAGLAQSLGAAPSRVLPIAIVRRGNWLLAVEGPDKTQCEILADVFRKL